LVQKQKVGAVMVVGAGIAGIQATLDLANSGLKVYLVDKEISIGGVMAQLDKTFPTNDCSACILSPKLVEVGRHPNVEILTRRKVKALIGEAGNFQVKLLKEPRFVDISKCTGCGDCAKVCPVSLPSPFNENLEKRKAIYRHFPQAIPSAYAVDKLGTAPCKAACPTHISVQGYVALIAQGKYKEALKLIKRDNPFPAVCGRVCDHPCENNCRRGDLDEPIDIMHLKRFVADLDLSSETRYIPGTKEKKGKRVAVIGAGPSGLTAAYYLAIEGYEVTCYEALPVPGGWLTAGIPEYRLPKSIINAEIKIIEDIGVQIKLNTRVGQDIPFEEIRKNFDALYVSVGSHSDIKLGIEGEEAEGVLSGIEFLKRVNLQGAFPLSGRVAVIGGGNVAMDAARSALRMGAEEVFVLYRRTEKEMPAAPEEVAEAKEEGIKMEFLVLPKRIILEEGKVRGVECLRMQLGELDASGRPRPIPIEGSEFVLPVDYVITAVGQKNDLRFIPKELGIVSDSGNIAVDPLTYATCVPGIFAGGDVVTGPATVVKAIAAGKEAAISIDRFLRGEDIRQGRLIDWQKEVAPPRELKEIRKVARTAIASRPVEGRKRDFSEVITGFTEEEARREAQRCLNCGICSECYQCVEACVAGALRHEERAEEETIEVGAVIVSPGFEVFDAQKRGEYGFGRHANVITSLQFERILSASGPYFGHIKRPSDGREPKKVAFIQCVGSRDPSCGHNWCSAVCCMYATKEAIVGKEHLRTLEPTIFFMDMRAYGKDFDRFIERAKKEYGIRYIRSLPSSIKELQQSKNLLISYVLEDGQLVEEEFDMVVLSVGLVPPREARELAEALQIELNEFGFAQVVKDNPLNSTRPGVYVCGVFAGPKDIPETVMEASGAAALVQELLAESRGTLIKEEETSLERDIRGLGPRTGVFVCHCGINIGGVVDVPKVVEYAKDLPTVVYATDNLFTCSQDAAVKMVEVIKEHNLTRVVVASCSPRTHEGLFQENCEKAGLNRYLFEMANIRDQDSWVHMFEPEKATEKAKDLVRMAVAKARLLKPLQPGQLTVTPKALIIGGGLAGMTAALSLMKMGFPSLIVEKDKELGGNFRKLRYTLEGIEAQEKLSSILKMVEESKLIETVLSAEIKRIEGFIGNYKTYIVSEGKEIVYDHGVIIIATGAYELKTNEYFYGRDERICTQRELEKLIHERDATVLKAKRIVMIQCVGSRNDERPYCSRYCCSQAVKNALRLKELDPEKEVYVLYREMRTFGFKEIYYERAREADIRFIRYDDGKNPEVTIKGEKLVVSFYDGLLREKLELEADLLALSVATVANPDNQKIAKLLKVPLNQDGFFLEAHVKLRPVEFATDGVFLCGLAHAPKFSDEVIVQARAAASRASVILTKDYILAEGKTAYVIKERCMACGLCEMNCPFGAVTVDRQERVATVNTVLCKGCGICTASCRMNAIDLNGFTNGEIIAQLQAL